MKGLNLAVPTAIRNVQYNIPSNTTYGLIAGANLTFSGNNSFLTETYNFYQCQLTLSSGSLNATFLTTPTNSLSASTWSCQLPAGMDQPFADY
jgi:hypothetical protein